MTSTAPSSCGCGYVAQNVVETDYSVVSGVLPQRFVAIQAALAAQKKRVAEGGAATGQVLPFNDLVCCNIGCPQAMGQPMITFPRLVMALVDAPCLMDHPKVGELFPADVVARARRYVAAMGGPCRTGAYSPPHGFPFIRALVADYITGRDAKSAAAADLPRQSSDDVMMTDGASVGIRQVMQLVSGSKADGILCPVPAYPLYTAMLTLLGATGMFYELEESEHGWKLTPESIEKALKQHGAWIPEGCTQPETKTTSTTAATVTPRCLILPNPGNPTGQVLSRAEMARIIRICHRHKMILLADEVYQENIYQPDVHPFESFRSVCLAMEEPIYRTETLIVSLHSVSKGLLAECGRRGGFMALTNCPPHVRAELMKLNSINICPNINGQIMTALMLDPPVPGDASYELYDREMRANFTSLQQKATVIAEALNAIPGISCTVPPGAMYVFPTVTLPKRYVEEHTRRLNEAEGVTYSPDTRWTLELLERYGIVVIPGDGFLQEAGTFHFRTTILPSDAQLERMISSIKAFQASVNEQFA